MEQGLFIQGKTHRAGGLTRRETNPLVTELKLDLFHEEDEENLLLLLVNEPKGCFLFLLWLSKGGEYKATCGF